MLRILVDLTAESSANRNDNMEICKHIYQLVVFSNTLGKDFTNAICFDTMLLSIALLTNLIRNGTEFKKALMDLSKTIGFLMKIYFLSFTFRNLHRVQFSLLLNI
jgi:hypothetical protein